MADRPKPDDKQPDPGRFWTIALWVLGVVILGLMTYEYTGKH